MFDHLKKFDKIVITGPGRSGTTIAAKIIADELKYKFVDEAWFSGTFFEIFEVLISEPRRKMVVQAPCLSHRLHEIGDRDNVAIVLMRRDIDDILESSKHTLTFNEKIIPDAFTVCDERWRKFCLSKYNVTEGCLPQIVYDYWDNYQKDKIKHSFELEYLDLKNHPLWIKKPERRKHFTRTKQINFDPKYIENQKYMCFF